MTHRRHINKGDRNPQAREAKLRRRNRAIGASTTVGAFLTFGLGPLLHAPHASADEGAIIDSIVDAATAGIAASSDGVGLFNQVDSAFDPSAFSSAPSGEEMAESMVNTGSPAASGTATAIGSDDGSLSGIFDNFIYEPAHELIESSLSNAAPVTGLFQGGLFGLGLIGNGADGTAAHPDGFNGGLLIGDGGDGYSGGDGGLKAGDGGDAGILFGTGGDGGAGTGFQDGGDGGHGGWIFGIGGDGGDGGVFGAGGDGGHAGWIFGIGGDAGIAGPLDGRYTISADQVASALADSKVSEVIANGGVVSDTDVSDALKQAGHPVSIFEANYIAGQLNQTVFNTLGDLGQSGIANALDGSYTISAGQVASVLADSKVSEVIANGGVVLNTDVSGALDQAGYPVSTSVAGTIAGQLNAAVFGAGGDISQSDIAHALTNSSYIGDSDAIAGALLKDSDITAALANGNGINASQVSSALDSAHINIGSDTAADIVNKLNALHIGGAISQSDIADALANSSYVLDNNAIAGALLKDSDITAALANGNDINASQVSSALDSAHINIGSDTAANIANKLNALHIGGAISQSDIADALRGDYNGSADEHSADGLSGAFLAQCANVEGAAALSVVVPACTYLASIITHDGSQIEAAPDVWRLENGDNTADSATELKESMGDYFFQTYVADIRDIRWTVSGDEATAFYVLDIKNIPDIIRSAEVVERFKVSDGLITQIEAMKYSCVGTIINAADPDGSEMCSAVSPFGA